MTAPDTYQTADAEGQGWRLLLGDSCERLAEFTDESVDLSIHSPPFDALYTYSASLRDLGNCATREDFLLHYGFVIRHLYRLTKPGRLACVHVMDLSTTKAAHGVTGLTDFSGQVIGAYQAEGWTYVGRVTIRKNPQAAAQRTHAQGLAFAQLRRDRSMIRPVHPDYLLTFRKPGENAVPLDAPIGSDESVSCFYCGRTGFRHRWAGTIDFTSVYACSPSCAEALPIGEDSDSVDNQVWIRWAEAIWDDIRETRTLNVAVAREERDERHICPLSLDIVERCVRLWANPDELVLSPFAGIGSEGVGALRYGRRFAGIELKASYWQTAVTNLRQAEAEASMPSLFDPAEAL